MIRQVLVFTVKDGDLKVHRKEVKDLQGDYDKTESRMKRFSSAAGGLFKAIIAGTAAALAALVGLAAKFGTAVEETQSKFDTVFGSGADGLQRFIDEFGRLAGLTDQQAQAILSQFGSIFQGAGATVEKSAELSKQILQLGADIASFNNVSAEEALNALRSGISGEIEPLKRFGILLDEATVKTRALSDTGKASADELTQLEKATARLAIIQERAGVAVGDLERTQGSAANTMRRLKTDVLNFRDTLGKALLPALSDVLTALDNLSQSVTGRNFWEALEKGAMVFGDALRGIIFVSTLIPEAVKIAYSKSAEAVVQAYASILQSTERAVSAISQVLLGLATATNNTPLIKSISSTMAAVKVGTQELVADANAAIEFHEGVVDASQQRIETKTRDFYARLMRQSQDAPQVAGNLIATTETIAKSLEAQTDKAAGFFRKLREEIQITKAATPELGSVLKDIFDIQAMIREGEALLPFADDRAAAEALLATLRTQEDILGKQRDRLIELAAGGDEFREKMIAAALQMLKVGQIIGAQFDPETGPLGDLVAGVNDAVKKALAAAEAQSGGLRIINPAKVRKDAEESAQELTKIALKLKAEFGESVPPQLVPVLDSMVLALKALGEEGEEALQKLGLEKVVEDLKDGAVNLDALADGLRAIERTADVFGLLSDGARDFAGGLIDAIDNIDNLKSGLAGLKGPNATGSLLDVIVPGLGIAAGLASSLVGVFGKNDDAAKRAQDENTRALKENADRVSDAIAKLISQLQTGSDTPGTSGASLQGLVERLLADAVSDPFNALIGVEERAAKERDAAYKEAAFRFGEGSDRYLEAVGRANREYFDTIKDARERAGDLLGSFFDNLDDLDLGSNFGQDAKDAMRELAEGLLAAGTPISDIFDAILEGGHGLEDGLLDVVRNLEGIGDFSDSLEGAVAKIRLLTTLGAVSAEDAIDQLVETVLSGDLQLSDALRSFIEGIDVSTEEGREALREAIAGLASTITGGGAAAEALLGEQTPQQVQDFLKELLNLIVSDGQIQTFTSPLQEAGDALRLFRNLMAGSATDALRLFANQLLESSDTFTGDLERLLALVSGGTGSTAEGRDALREEINRLATQLLVGNDLGTDEAESILNTLLALINEASGTVGQISDPVNEANNSLRIFRQLLEGDVSDSLRLFANKLLEDGPQDDRLRALLDEVARTGGETPEDRARIDSLIKQIAQGLLAGDDFGLSSDKVEALLGQIAGLLDEAEAADAADSEFTSSVQIARTITDVQGNEVIIRLSELRYLAEERNELLGQLVSLSGAPFGFESLPSQSAVTNIEIGAINVSAALNIESITSEVSERLAEALREQGVGGFPTG